MKTGMTQDDAAIALRGILPLSRRPSGSQISRIETGETKEPEVYIVAALARIYQRPLEEIAPELIGEAIAVRTLLKDVIDLTDQAKPPSSCNYASRPDEPQLPFPNDSEVVVDLREHVLAQIAQNESVGLLAATG